MIRELRKEDRDSFILMVTAFYSSDAVLHSIPVENILETYNEVISCSPYLKAYIIEKDQEMAGYGLLSFTYSNEAGGMVVWVEELYITPKYRDLKLGSQFLDFVKGKFSSKAKRFRLEVSKSNKSVQQLYESKGYTPLDYLQMVYNT